jgi:hypothetical protein
MKHLQRFNEEFDFGRLNIFSDKNVDSKDEQAAKAAYSSIKRKINGQKLVKPEDFNLNISHMGDVKRSAGLLTKERTTQHYTITFTFDNDNFILSTYNPHPKKGEKPEDGRMLVNDERIMCSKSTIMKFIDLMKSLKERADEEKSVGGFRSKYSK